MRKYMITYEVSSPSGKSSDLIVMSDVNLMRFTDSDAFVCPWMVAQHIKETISERYYQDIRVLIVSISELPKIISVVTYSK